MQYKVRCKTCQATAKIDTEAKTWDIQYPREGSPYGSSFPHPSMKECPLTAGFSVETLLTQDDIEVL